MFFGLENKFSSMCFQNKYVFLLFFSFLFQFTSPAYKLTFISISYIICNVDFLKETSKIKRSYLDL